MFQLEELCLVEYVKSLSPIFLVRHGQALNNIDSGVGGYQDPPLTDLGRRQAQAAGKRLAKELDGIDFTVYCSPLKRANETASIICGELKVEPIVIDELQEYMTRLDPAIPLAEAKKMWTTTTGHTMDWSVCEGAETMGELYHRAADVLTKINDKDEKLKVIVSHGWLLDKMIAWWVGVPIENIKPNIFTKSNASISELTVTDYNERVLLRLNDRIHLQSLD